MAGSILDALEAVRDTVATATGIVTSYRDLPEQPPDDAKLPAAITRLDTERTGLIEISALERWEHPIRVDVLVKRAGAIQDELPAVYPHLSSVVAAFRANATLLGFGALHHDVGFRVGQLAIWNEVFWGASLLLVAEEHLEVTITA